MRKLAVVPVFENIKPHNKPFAYEVHDVTDIYITRFPVAIDKDGTRRQTLQSEVTFKSEAKAQAWIDEQMERDDAKA